MAWRVFFAAAFTLCIGLIKAPPRSAGTVLTVFFAAMRLTIFGAILHGITVSERSDNPRGFVVFIVGCISFLSTIVYIAVNDVEPP